MPTTLYQDPEITVTESAIKTPQFTMYVNQITTVVFVSTRFLSQMLPMIVMMVVMGGVGAFFLGKILGRLAFLPILTAGLPLAILVAVMSFLRKTTLKLLTTGGVVVLVHKISFTDQPDLVSRCEKIRAAIEQARAAQT